jgi:intracellular multiplication protein IcmC
MKVTMQPVLELTREFRPRTRTATRLKVISIAIALGFASAPAWADGDIGNLPAVLTANLNIVVDIMQTIAILLGLALFLGGMFQLKRYGEARTMMSSQMSMTGPLMMLLSGIAMLCSPLMIGTLLVAFWGPGGATDLPYDGDTSYGWSQYIQPIIIFVRVIGIFAFMRGFMMVARTGGQTQQGTTGKALIHVFAGILCVHIMGTIKLLESILGFSFSL